MTVSALTETVTMADFTAHIVRTRRVKTIGIKIVQSRVVVSVPKRAQLVDIELILLAKRRWIERKLAEQASLQGANDRHYRCGESVLYKGLEYALKISHADHTTLHLDSNNHRLHIHLPKHLDRHDELREILANWYKQRALAYFLERVEHYAPRVGAWPKRVKVRRCKSRWGSCSTLGNINFNWLLIMAPTPVIDYVVVHELCHLLEHNHSPAFWHQVALAMPDYREHKQWLKSHGYCLAL